MSCDIKVVLLYLTDEAYDEGEVVYFSFGDREVWIIGIGRVADNVVIGVEYSLDNDALGGVEDVSTAPLNEPRLVYESASEFVARENVGSH